MNKKIVLFGIIFIMLLFTNVAMAVAPTLSNESPTDESTLWEIDTTSFTVDVNCTSGTFDWNITSSPNVGNAGATGESNGTKSCTVSGLEFSTTYTWYVNSTNGTLWTNALYTFTTRNAKLRENSAFNSFEKTIIGVVGIIILIGFLFYILKMDFKNDKNLAKMFIAVMLALIFLGIIFSAL